MSDSFVTPWTVAPEAPLSTGFPRQECWSRLPCPASGDLPDPGIKPTSLMPVALAGGFSTTSTNWEAFAMCTSILFCVSGPVVLAAHRVAFLQHHLCSDSADEAQTHCSPGCCLQSHARNHDRSVTASSGPHRPACRTGSGQDFLQKSCV